MVANRNEHKRNATDSLAKYSILLQHKTIPPFHVILQAWKHARTRLKNKKQLHIHPLALSTHAMDVCGPWRDGPFGYWATRLHASRSMRSANDFHQPTGDIHHESWFDKRDGTVFSVLIPDEEQRLFVLEGSKIHFLTFPIAETNNRCWLSPMTVVARKFRFIPIRTLGVRRMGHGTEPRVIRVRFVFRASLFEDSSNTSAS